MTKRLHYGATAKVLHWMVVGLLAIQYPIGWLMPDIHLGMSPGAAMTWHISIGTAIIMLIVYRSPARSPLGQLVGPPCSCLVPAFNAQVTDFTIFMARVFEWAGKDRHSIDGPATGTGIFTAIAGSHAGFGALRGHKDEYAPFGPSRKSFRSLPYSKGPATNRPPHLTFLGATSPTAAPCPLYPRKLPRHPLPCGVR